MTYKVSRPQKEDDYIIVTSIYVKKPGKPLKKKRKRLNRFFVGGWAAFKAYAVSAIGAIFITTACFEFDLIVFWAAACLLVGVAIFLLLMGIMYII